MIIFGHCSYLETLLADYKSTVPKLISYYNCVNIFSIPIRQGCYDFDKVPDENSEGGRILEFEAAEDCDLVEMRIEERNNRGY